MKALEEYQIIHPGEVIQWRIMRNPFFLEQYLWYCCTCVIHVWIQTVQNTLSVMKHGKSSGTSHFIVDLKVLTLRRQQSYNQGGENFT